MIDFELDNEKKRKVPPIGAINLVLIALVFAILGVVCLFPKVYYGCAIFGALGLLLGGYAMGYTHKHSNSVETAKKLFILSGAALIISVIAFMFGFVGIAGSL
ncbi:MAG: hypothetical protein J5707_02890 [Candidatus Methanomethylophilus sp.]|nr:hypothetical protein [Methanomethylophilus sp.]